MSDAQREFKVKITSFYDPSGSHAAAGHLGDLSSGIKKAAENTEGFNLQGREARKLVALLERESSLAGAALKALLEPETVGIAGIVIALETVVEWVHKTTEAAEQAAERWRESYSDYIASANEASAATRELHQANEEFWASFRRRREEESEKNTFNLALEEIKERTEAQKKFLETQKQFELESINAAVASGKMSPAQADARRSQIEGAYRDSERGVDQFGDRSAIAERTRQINQLNKEIEAARDHNREANGPQTQERQGTLTTAIQSLSKYMEDLKTAFANQTAIGPSPIYTGAKNQSGVAKGDFQYEDFAARQKEADETLGNLKTELARLQAESQRTRDELDRKTTQRNQLVEENAAAENRATRTAESTAQIAALNNLADQIKQLSSLGVLGQTNSRRDPYNPNQFLYNNPVADDIFNQGVSALRARQHLLPGQKLSEQQQQQIDALNNLVAALGWGPQVVANVDRLISTNQSLAGQVKAMDSRIQQIEATVRTGSTLNHR